MGVEVRSKLGNSVSRSLSGSSLIGDGMLVRLRSSTLAILGLVAAVGLGMVAVVSQQGWPDVRTGALPQAPSTNFVHNDAIAAPVGTFGPPPLFDGIEASAPVRPDRRTAGSNAVPASNLTAARQVTAAPAEPVPVPPSAAPEPVSQEPASTPPASTPSPARAVAGVGAATGGGSSPVTAGVGQSPGRSDEDREAQGEPGSTDNEDHDHGWGNDRRDDQNDNTGNDWSSGDRWDDNDRDHGWGDDSDGDRRDYDFDRGSDNDDRGGQGRH